MEKAELAALLTAHHGRTQPVASLHVLRASSLSADDHAFLVEHAETLATIDLSRWLRRASPEQRPQVMDALDSLAVRDPARFEFEIARAPHFGMEKAERDRLADRLRGRAPERLVNSLSPSASAPEPPPTLPQGAFPLMSDPPSSRHAGARRRAPDGESLFDPGELLGGVDFAADSVPGRSAGPSSEGDLGGLFNDLDSAGGAGATSRTPLLDALLADEAAKRGRKARAAWKSRVLVSAKDTQEDWSPSVTRLPEELRDAVSARAALSPRAEERACLLEWLLQNGARKSTLVGLTLGTLGLGDAAQNIRPWLAQTWVPKLLSDKAGWAKYGARLVAALAEQGAYSELDDLFTAALAGSSALGPGLGSLPVVAGDTQELRSPMFFALFEALAGALRQALVDGDRKVALACSAALASIGVPAPKSPAVRTIRRKRSARGEVATLLDLALKQSRGPKKLPQLEDFIAAVHSLSNAMRG